MLKNRKLTRMKFKNEVQLYKVFGEAIKELEEKFRNHPIFDEDRINGKFRYLDRRLNRQRLHLVGEMYYSRKPVDYIHQNLVACIERSPKTWLVLRENAGKIVVEDPVKYPTLFYLQELAKLFRLPYEEALADLHAPDTRGYIKRKTGISEEDIDRLILTDAMGFVKVKDLEKNLPYLVIGISKNLQRSIDDTLRLFLLGPNKDLDFDEVIGKHLNDYSRERFHQLLKKYPDRNDVLISVSYSHFPAFE